MYNVCRLEPTLPQTSRLEGISSKPTKAFATTPLTIRCKTFFQNTFCRMLSIWLRTHRCPNSSRLWNSRTSTVLIFANLLMLIRCLNFLFEQLFQVSLAQSYFTRCRPTISNSLKICWKDWNVPRTCKIPSPKSVYYVSALIFHRMSTLCVKSRLILSAKNMTLRSGIWKLTPEKFLYQRHCFSYQENLKD